MALELDDRHFVALAMSSYGGANFAAIYVRCADFHVVAVAQHQNRIKIDIGSFFGIQFLDPQGVTLLTRYCLPPVINTACIWLIPSGPASSPAQLNVVKSWRREAAARKARHCGAKAHVEQDQ